MELKALVDTEARWDRPPLIAGKSYEIAAEDVSTYLINGAWYSKNKFETPEATTGKPFFVVGREYIHKVSGIKRKCVWADENYAMLVRYDENGVSFGSASIRHDTGCQTYDYFSEMAKRYVVMLVSETQSCILSKPLKSPDDRHATELLKQYGKGGCYESNTHHVQIVEVMVPV